MEERLFPIKCPRLVYNKKTGEMMKCNKLCVKVTPGSEGEAYCRFCKLPFHFVVDSQAKSILSIKARPVDE